MWCPETPFLFEYIYVHNHNIWHQMSFAFFDTQFGAQGMENIGEIWYCLIPFLMQGGPSGVLVLIAFYMVLLFFNGIARYQIYKICRTETKC